MQSVLVLGASGFVGDYCVRILADNGFKIKALTSNPDYVNSLPFVEIIVGSFESLECWEKHLEGVDCVINLAGEYRNESRMQQVNFHGPAALLKSCINAGIGRWIQLSSVGAYGPIQSGTVTESYPDRPEGIYELSKSQFDDLLRCTVKNSQIKTTILRPSIIYGIGMKNTSLLQLINMIQRRLFVFVGPKKSAANYVHVMDVAYALLLCLKNDVSNNKTYIVSNCGSMEELVSAAAKGVLKPTPSLRIHPDIARLIATLCKKIPRFPLTPSRVEAFNNDVIYCSKKIEEELGWQPAVSLSAGIESLASSELNRS